MLSSAKAIAGTSRGIVSVEYDAAGRPVARKSSVLAVAANFHAPAVNTAAVVTFALVGNATHVLGGIAYSYDSSVTGGNLTVKDGTTVVFNLDIALADAKTITFNPPLRGTKGTAMVITLAAGGSACTGKVNAIGKTTESA